MSIENTTATAPDHWASYLVNGDASGLDPEDAAAVDLWAESLRPWRIVSTEEDDAGFMRWHDAAPFYPYAANCAVYILHKDS